MRCQLSPVIEPVVVRSAWQGPQGIRYQDSVTLERGSTLAILAWPRPRQGWPAGSYRVEISKREQTSTLEFTIAGPAAVEPVDHLGLPRRVDGLKPFDEELKTGWPRFMVAAFAKKNGGRQVRVPVKVVSLLGKCQTDQYDCFNIPKHHLQHEKDDESYLSRMGRYYWYDLELTGGDGQVLPLRVVYNEGDADCNDGLWGEMWNRNNYEKVADLTSTGDCESTLTATPAYRARFKSHPFQVPTDADYEGEGFGGVFWRLEYGHDDQLERLLGVGLLLADLQDAKDDIDWQPMSVR
ncbi:MAG: hypothetical protein HY319_21580 [Armatimonadetes bacterium]|nr:hypothetical protein [Armatimonadota bacterium]